MLIYNRHQFRMETKTTDKIKPITKEKAVFVAILLASGWFGRAAFDATCVVVLNI